MRLCGGGQEFFLVFDKALALHEHQRLALADVALVIGEVQQVGLDVPRAGPTGGLDSESSCFLVLAVAQSLPEQRRGEVTLLDNVGPIRVSVTMVSRA
jgi:hypothetical protein